ncbi:hypothetical protein ABT236_22865 [Streptomyces sp. NPDC001523]|uniref:effector-associated constant component EACC1 n=1 Tax=Streptomyces sp. NPDC001523 TaxID=3154383 RepID=UPI00331E9D23
MVLVKRGREVLSGDQQLISVTVVADPDGQQTRSLRRWLQRDAKLSASSGITPSTAKPDPESMSGGLEWLDFAVSTAIGMGSLITSIATWCSTRAAGQQVRLSSDRGGHAEVSADETDPDRARERAAEVIGDETSDD